MAKNAIGLAIATEEYGAKFFANGAAPGGVLEHPGTIKDPQRVRQLGENARDYLVKNMDRRDKLDQTLQLLQTLARA